MQHPSFGLSVGDVGRTYKILINNKFLFKGVTAHLKAEVDGIDRNDVFPGEILQGARQKGLGEVKSGDPEHRRYAVVHPLVKEFHPGF